MTAELYFKVRRLIHVHAGKMNISACAFVKHGDTIRVRVIDADCHVAPSPRC
jgi:hypothetical protein